jgi:hypothetical protein
MPVIWKGVRSYNAEYVGETEGTTIYKGTGLSRVAVAVLKDNAIIRRGGYASSDEVIGVLERGHSDEYFGFMVTYVRDRRLGRNQIVGFAVTNSIYKSNGSSAGASTDDIREAMCAAAGFALGLMDT